MKLPLSESLLATAKGVGASVYLHTNFIRHWAAEAAALEAQNAALLDACLVVKAFLDRLEARTAPDDPLLAIRREVHAPLHEKLDAAMKVADGR